MPITLACTCGKPLRVADQYAGKLVRCPVCGATQRAGGQPVAAQPPAAQAETADDFEVLEETVPTPMELPPEPVAPVPAKTRLKAAVVAVEPAAPAPAPAAAPAKPKKKKKKKKASAAAKEGDDDWYERTRENEAWMRRVFRGSAFIVVGVLILVGVAVMYFGYREDVTYLQEEGGRSVLGLILLTVFGLASIGKGVIGLAFGQFLGEDE